MEVKLHCDMLKESYLICVRRGDKSDVSLLLEYFKKYFFVKLISIFRESEDDLEPHEKYRNAYTQERCN